MLTMNSMRIDRGPCPEQSREKEQKQTEQKPPVAVTCRDLAVFHVSMVLTPRLWLKIPEKIKIMESIRPLLLLFQGAGMAGKTCGAPLRPIEDEAIPEHLIIMVNGITGNATNWRYAADQFVKRLPDKVVVHCSQCNSSTRTFDGVDQMGNRLAEEVKEIIENRPGVKRISFVSHSLGGLVSRYAIGVLYEPPSGSSTGAQNNCDIIDGNFNQDVEEESKGKIAGLEPVNFITFATPHLGSRGYKQLPFVCGLPMLEKAASQSAHWFVGRSGRHLFLTDKDDGKPPLLCRMVTDCGDLYFMSALRAFKRRVAYSNVSYDHMVGWRTASIRRQCELPELRKVPVNEKYPHIVNVEIGNDGNSITRVAASKSDHITDAVEGIHAPSVAGRRPTRIVDRGPPSMYPRIAIGERYSCTISSGKQAYRDRGSRSPSTDPRIAIGERFMHIQNRVQMQKIFKQLQNVGSSYQEQHSAMRIW